MSKMPSGRPLDAPMSPAQAAQSKNVSRRTIMRAINEHALMATRDNRNHWKIDPQELDRWAKDHWAPSERAHLRSPIAPTSDLEVKLAVVEAERDAFKARLTEIQEDRDKWREMADKLADKPRWVWPWRR